MDSPHIQSLYPEDIDEKLEEIDLENKIFYDDDYFLIKHDECNNDYKSNEIFEALQRNKISLIDLRKISCIFDKTFLVSNLESIIRDITQIKQIGTGSSGYVMSFDLQNKKFVLKNFTTRIKALRELFVAICINKIIEEYGTPTLMYMYGYLENIQRFNKNFNLIYDYNIIYEYIGGKALIDVTPIEFEDTLKNVLSTLLSILMTLALVYNETQFIHGDLNNNNIMVTSNPTGKVTFMIENKVYTLKTNKLYVIIDYGLSRVGTSYVDPSSPCCLEDILNLGDDFYSISKKVRIILYNSLSRIIPRVDLDRMFRLVLNRVPMEFKSITYEDILDVVLNYSQEKFGSTLDEILTIEDI